MVDKTEKPANDKSDLREQASAETSPASKKTSENKPIKPSSAVEKTVSKQKPKNEQTPTAEEKKSFTGLLSVVAIFIAVGAVGANAWFYLQLQATQGSIATNARQTQDIKASFEVLSEHPALARLRQQDAELQKEIHEKLNAYDTRVLELAEIATRAHTAATRGETTWSFSEVEYLLRIGVYRLNLLDDVDGAISAYLAADQSLHRLADPQLIPLRKHIHQDIATLRKLPRPDIAGVAIQLSSLINQVPLLPRPNKISRPHNSQATVDPEESFANTVLNHLRQYVIIRRDGQATTSPQVNTGLEDLRQHLIYALSAARAAALSGNDEDYRSALGSISENLQQHFDQDNPVTQSFSEQLGMLHVAPIRLVTPDINGSINLLLELETEHKSPALEADAS